MSIRAAIYGRFSTNEQSESSIEDQIRVCTDWCANNGAAVGGRFEDQGISGAAIGNRPGLQAALAASVDAAVRQPIGKVAAGVSTLVINGMRASSATSESWISIPYGRFLSNRKGPWQTAR